MTFDRFDFGLAGSKTLSNIGECDDGGSFRGVVQRFVGFDR